VFNFRSNGAHIYLGTRSKMSGKPTYQELCRRNFPRSVSAEVKRIVSTKGLSYLGG
jgi:hypothetical protein